MNTYRKVIQALVIGLNIASQAHAANGNLTKLDQEGINLAFDLTSAYENFINTTIYPLNKAKAIETFEEWNFLLKTNVEAYVQDYSTAMSAQDKDLIGNLNLLLQTNNDLLQKINAMPDYYKTPGDKNDANKFYMSTEDIAKPFEAIEQTIQKIQPELERLSFYIDKKSKAKEILVRAFTMTHLMTQAIIKQIKAYRNKLLWIKEGRGSF